MALLPHANCSPRPPPWGCGGEKSKSHAKISLWDPLGINNNKAHIFVFAYSPAEPREAKPCKTKEAKRGHCVLPYPGAVLGGPANIQAHHVDSILLLTSHLASYLESRALQIAILFGVGIMFLLPFLKERRGVGNPTMSCP